MDQVNFPDPVKEELTALHHSNSELTNRLIDLERKVMRLGREAIRKQKPNRTEEK